ncbi:MAG: nucleotide pyrophosphohydrolase [Candidatus Riflebacteria bacterium]|nr:nucleotide pyrophosphohydrolase [Candidatus Riflebacteria bacterium]
MNDQQTTVQELKNLVEGFIEARNWKKFHSPRNLAVSVAIEAAELLEHFQWEPDASLADQPEKITEIGEEMADVMAYLISLANTLKIDISKTLSEKMKKNAVKYPSEEFNGVWKKQKTL